MWPRAAWHLQLTSLLLRDLGLCGSGRGGRDGLVKVGVKGQSRGMLHRDVTSEQISKVKCTEHLSP